MQIVPSPSLTNLVRHFLIIETDLTQRLRIFSDGNTGIVFNYGDPLLHENPLNGEKSLLPQSFLYGQLDQYQHVLSTGKVRLLAVVLHSQSLSAILSIPASELKNQLLDLKYFFGNDAENIPEKIFAADHVAEKCAVVEHFLIQQVQNTYIEKSVAGRAVQLIHQHHGNLPVSQLMNELQVGERTLQRIFDAQIGLSPKRYSGVIRMQKFLKLLRKTSPGAHIVDPVFECGFYDHAHLIREMKQLSGITPRQYLGQKMLAANFFQIPA
ncbi:helix-turn-helix domain-containing protein [Dyadobacter luticola]|uniref:Helix-turn-helix transcriptional regulator n=1 Tax=Dyadobacter luticola TaxID=1979387 RepID=A0A5R9L5K2_9BACT|nr:AraC family transcriptional regulator [Dyadobacter luticola]TLV03852.1 helix-turn-helix transcriptional regulator [Dyadobacter luticola]